jgi:hypothetical protein
MICDDQYVVSDKNGMIGCNPPIFEDFSDILGAQGFYFWPVLSHRCAVQYYFQADVRLSCAA